MNTRELKRTIAARLPNCIQKEAQEVLTVLMEVVRKKLMEIDHSIYIQGLEAIWKVIKELISLTPTPLPPGSEGLFDSPSPHGGSRAGE